MLSKQIELDFGKVYIHENILIAKLDGGILLDLQSNEILLKLGAEIFKNRDYVYISHRVNSYAVDTMDYIDSANTQNLKAIAVVSKNEMIRKNAEGVERKFYKDNNCFSVFQTLE